MKNNIIQNMDNYNKILNATDMDVFIKYIGLVNEYLQLCGENIYMQNHNYLRFVMKRGLETLSSVFNMLLLYTRNLDLTFYHGQKAFYYYVEFIGQIGDDNHSFLQLNSKDATLFVYKKTIFDINNEYRKDFIESDEEEEKYIKIKILIDLYNKLLIEIINNNNFPDDNNAKLLKEINGGLYRIVENIIQATLKTKNDDNLKVIEYLITNILIRRETNNILRDKYLNYIEIFAKKIKKKSVSLDTLRLKLHDTEFEQRLEDHTVLKVVNWLCNSYKLIGNIFHNNNFFTNFSFFLIFAQYHRC